MVRWINLALALVLAAVLFMELMRSEPTEEPAPAVQTARTAVVTEKPGRRARRQEARVAIEESRRQQRERGRGPTGSVELDADGRPFRD